MNIYVAYTAARWSEVIGLLPECVHDDQVAIDWKLYELNGRFYRGRPKDGSMRPADLPPFLAQLLAGHLADTGSLKCTCRNTEQPWCPGAECLPRPRPGAFPPGERRAHRALPGMRPGLAAAYRRHADCARRTRSEPL